MLLWTYKQIPSALTTRMSTIFSLICDHVASITSLLPWKLSYKRQTTVIFIFILKSDPLALERKNLFQVQFGWESWKILFVQFIMSVNELFCENLLQYFSSFSDLKDLRSTYVANCVFNNFLTYSTIMLNIVTIFAIRKTSTLPKTLKTLLLSLAVSDVGVGLFVQPFYTSLLVNWLQQNNPSCYTYRIFQIFANLFSVASFLGVVAVSVDRF